MTSLAGQNDDQGENLPGRERADHDAAPAAIAQTDSATGEPGGGHGSGRTDKAVTRPVMGTGRITRAAYEGDIVSRLRNWHGLHLAHGGRLFEEAADEIDRLREAIRRLAEQDATLSVQGGNVIVEMDATLTAAERLAIREAADAYAGNDDDADCERISHTLRGLLARTSACGNRQ